MAFKWPKPRAWIYCCQCKYASCSIWRIWFTFQSKGATLIHRFVGIIWSKHIERRKGFQDLLKKGYDIYEWHAVHCSVFVFMSWKLLKCIFREAKQRPDKCSRGFILHLNWHAGPSYAQHYSAKLNSLFDLVMFCLVFISHSLQILKLKNEQFCQDHFIGYIDD